MRTADELRAVVDADPLGTVADNGSRYLVSFLRAAPKKPDFAADAFAPELFHLGGQEIYFWVPGRQPELEGARRVPHQEG